jgi:IS30 family transposase
MQIQMRNAEQLDREQISELLHASESIDFIGQSAGEIYGWVQRVLVHQEYFRQSRKDRGLLRAYLCKMTGRSRAQITRLIRQQKDSGQIRSRRSVRQRFPTKYSDRDLELLVEVDRAHEQLSGPATRHILQREHQVFGKSEFSRLAQISVSHLYNLRRREAYRRRTVEFETTRPTAIRIGERRRPDSQGQPGWLRIDTVHQGNWEGSHGVYHINAVDEVTQWEVIGCTSTISERGLIPVLEAMLHQFPFRIQSIHADNGSEFVNHSVAKLLGKLLIEFTRSRPNRSSDNALVEGKNGSIIRKHLGYGHMAVDHAERIHKFYAAHLNPYLNYHRPCGFATVTLDERGKRKRIYKAVDYRTPYEKLKSLEGASGYLKLGVDFEQLDRLAGKHSDTEAARHLREAKIKLLRLCKSESPLPPRF